MRAGGGHRRREGRVARGGRRGIGDLRQAEVQHLGLAVLGELDVGGFEVAVDDAGFVGGFEPGGDLASSSQGLVERERAVVEPLGQVFAGNELHGEEMGFLILVYAVDAGDVGVVQARQEAGFAVEAGQAVLVGGEVRGEDLDGDFAVKCGVRGLPDRTHAAFADLLDQAVVEQLLSGFDGQGRPSCVIRVRIICLNHRLVEGTLVATRRFQRFRRAD